MDDGHDAPEGVRLFQEEKSNGGQSVKTLAVADVLIVPAECYQDTSKLVNLKRRKGLLKEIYTLYTAWNFGQNDQLGSTV